MKKVLIIGLGSIGQRHAKALISIGNIQIAALRTGKGKKEIDIALSKKIIIFTNEDDAFKWQPTHIIISNPTSCHKKYINYAIQQNCRFFVEKPISDNIDDILEYQEPNNINGIVGYNLRFHGLFQFIKRIINDKLYGNIITAQFHVGQYLPSWHPYEDYSMAYYSKKDLGGGAIRTLSHEIDLAQYLLGNLKSVYAKVQKLSNLNIDVDDVTNILCETVLCKQVSIHINFLDPNVVRKGVIYFDEGVLNYNFIKSEVVFTKNSKEKEVVYSEKEDYDNQYIQQMRELLSDEKTGISCTFRQGIQVMNIIDKCEESNYKKTEICLV